MSRRSNPIADSREKEKRKCVAGREGQREKETLFYGWSARSPDRSFFRRLTNRIIQFVDGFFLRRA